MTLQNHGPAAPKMLCYNPHGQSDVAVSATQAARLGGLFNAVQATPLAQRSRAPARRTRRGRRGQRVGRGRRKRRGLVPHPRGGTPMALASGEGLQFLLRWFHFLAGITWIGMLYYFNFVQTPFFATAEPQVRSGMIVGSLVGRALWWFRWGAMFTFITGWLIILHVMFAQYGGFREFFATAYGWKIFFGGMLGSLMWANVWFVIWPAQQVVMASATEVSRGGQAIPDAAARGQRAGFASRTNTLLSIPMLFFMGAAKHLTMAEPTGRGAKIGSLILLLVVLAAAEINAMVGTTGPGKKMLTTVSGTFWGGFILTA